MPATQVERYKFTQKMRDELGATYGMAVVGMATQLLRHGTTYARYQEDWCNVEMSEEETTRREAREGRLEARIAELCEPFDVQPVFGGDPRGHTIKLKMPSGFTDDWGKEGLCVPTS